MPNKCCVPGCKGNYKLGPKVHVFMFPRDEELRRAWVRAIPRENYVVTKCSAVCELHFADDDIIREKSGVDAATGSKVTVRSTHVHLRPGAVPSKFCSAALQNEQDAADKILDLKDLTDLVRSDQFSAFWYIIEGNDRLTLMHIVEDDAPWIKYSVVVKANLTVSFHVAKTRVSRLGSNLSVPNVAKSKKAVTELLQNIENWDGDLISNSESLEKDIIKTILLLLSKLSPKPAEDKAHVIQFLSEQFKLLSTKEHKCYSVDFMLFSCILFTMSPHVYKYIQSSGNITLPHLMTIRSICSSFGMDPQPEHRGATFLSYVAKRISDLEDHQRFVILTVDEINIKPYFEYKSGSVTNVVLNPTEVADSMLVFMVQSLTCQFREIAHMVAVQKTDAQFLHNLLRDVICGLEKFGYRVACVVSEDNPMNRKAMSLFTSPPTSGIVYPHPSDPARPLFFVIDPAHILKCIRDNWIDQSNDLLCFYFPEFEIEPGRARHMLSASFATIRDAYNLERDDKLRFRYNLSREAVYPSNIERQNVKLALQIFSNSLPRALRSLGVRHDLKFFKATAIFIEIIVKWWTILNMELPGKGKRDQLQNPVFSEEDDPNLDFLYKLLDWLDEWKSKDLDSGTLARETHAALQQTTHAIVEVIRYCFTELKLSYILLGKIRTGSLDERFGKYRKLAGTQYHVSIRQLYEGVDELRLQNMLPMIAADCGTGSDRDEHWEDLNKRELTVRPCYNVVVTGQALSRLEDILLVLVYVAGYAVRATLKRLNCAKCRAALTVNKMIAFSVPEQYDDLVKELGGGGLLFPTMFAVNAVAYSYVVSEQLSKQVEFSKMPDQCQIITDLTVELLTNEEFSDFDACEDGHTSELVLRHVLWCSTNILLKNFFCNMNNVPVAKARSRKRKAN